MNTHVPSVDLIRPRRTCPACWVSRRTAPSRPTSPCRCGGSGGGGVRRCGPTPLRKWCLPRSRTRRWRGGRSGRLLRPHRRRLTGLRGGVVAPAEQSRRARVQAMRRPRPTDGPAPSPPGRSQPHWQGAPDWQPQPQPEPQPQAATRGRFLRGAGWSVGSGWVGSGVVGDSGMGPPRHGGQVPPTVPCPIPGRFPTGYQRRIYGARRRSHAPARHPVCVPARYRLAASTPPGPAAGPRPIAPGTRPVRVRRASRHAAATPSGPAVVTSPTAPGTRPTPAHARHPGTRSAHFRGRRPVRVGCASRYAAGTLPGLAAERLQLPPARGRYVSNAPPGTRADASSRPGPARIPHAPRPSTRPRRRDQPQPKPPPGAPRPTPHPP